MRAGRSTPFITTAIRLPAPASSVLSPNPLTTFVVPLAAGDMLRRESEGVLVAILGNSIADDDQRITDRSRDSQNLEICLGKVAEVVEIVHLVFDKKEGVFGIVGGGRGTDDHPFSICAVTGNAVRGAAVATESSQIGDGKIGFGANANKTANENA